MDRDGLVAGSAFEPDPDYRWRPQPGDKYPGKVDGKCLLICTAIKTATGMGVSEGAGRAQGPLNSLGHSRVAGAIGWARNLGRTPAMGLIGLGGAMEFCERQCQEPQSCVVEYNSPTRSDFPNLSPISSYGRR